MAAPTSVEDYLASLPEGSRAALEKLRKTIKAAAPEAKALDGELHLLSPEGGPTVLMVEIPCAS